MDKAIDDIADVVGGHLDLELTRLFLDHRAEMVAIRVELAD